MNEIESNRRRFDGSSNASVKPALLTMDETLFCRLLEGPGKVLVDIVMLDQYFVPFVSFCADAGASPVRHGAIVRGKSDLLAAKTAPELVAVLRDIAGDSASLEIHPVARDLLNWPYPGLSAAGEAPDAAGFSIDEIRRLMGVARASCLRGPSVSNLGS
jgi:hypothetical protein